MVSILPGARGPWDLIGQSIGQNLSSTLPGAVQQGFNRGQLQSAFNSLNPQENFIEQLKTIAPTLLSTPGGAQALGELAPVLGTYARNEAYKNFIQNQRTQQTQPEITPQQISPIAQKEAQKPQAPTPEDYYRHPDKYASPESLYPEMPAGYQERPEMTLPQMNAAALDLMDQSQMTGKPISFPEALNAVQKQNEIIKSQNERIRSGKEAQKQANKELTAGMINRAENAGLIKDPEDNTVVEKLALEARRLKDPNDQWLHVRTGMRKFDNAKSSIKTSADLTGPLGNLYRQMKGTYQDAEEIIRHNKPWIDEYKKYGLHNELRRDLGEYLGLGPDQVETAIFPPSMELKKEMNEFQKNPKKMLNKFGEEPLVYRDQPFPGQDFKLDEKDFEKFKNNIAQIIKNNPGINLVSFRGKLNQDKRYAWQDISRAVEELVEERRFTPDNIQEQQLNIISKEPAPGLLQQFLYFWKGKK